MRNDFASMFGGAQQPQQPQQNSYSYLSDPMVLAGFGIAQGMPMEKAMVLAAEMKSKQQNDERQQSAHQMKQQEFAQQQLMMQNLPDALKNLDVSNPGAAISMLVQQGLDPAQAASIVSNLANQQLQRQKLAQSNAAGLGMSALEQKLLFEKYKMDNARDEKKLIKQEKILEENEEQAGKANEILSQLDELESLLPQFRTGVGSDVAQIFNKTVGSSDKAASYERFNSLSGKLVLDAAKELKGTISDKDLDFLEKQTPSATLTQSGNLKIINGLKEAAKRKIQYTEAANQYVGQGGDLKEFNKEWRKKVANESIFKDPDNEKSPKNSMRNQAAIEAEMKRRGLL